MVERTRELEMSGFEEYAKMAGDLAPKQARNLARSTVHAVAGEARKMMRKEAPKDEGTLRRAIKTKRRSMRGSLAVSDVRIEHGRQAKHDAWYWHMIEFGSQNKSARPYIRPTADKLEQELPRLWSEQFGKKLEKALAKLHAQQGVKS